jgi:hypothetical protein
LFGGKHQLSATHQPGDRRTVVQVSQTGARATVFPKATKQSERLATAKPHSAARPAAVGPADWFHERRAVAARAERDARAGICCGSFACAGYASKCLRIVDIDRCPGGIVAVTWTFCGTPDGFAAAGASGGPSVAQALVHSVAARPPSRRPRQLTMWLPRHAASTEPFTFDRAHEIMQPRCAPRGADIHIGGEMTPK